jgi:hypothetical protein
MIWVLWVTPILGHPQIGQIYNTYTIHIHTQYHTDLRNAASFSSALLSLEWALDCGCIESNQTKWAADVLVQICSDHCFIFFLPLKDFKATTQFRSHKVTHSFTQISDPKIAAKFVMSPDLGPASQQTQISTNSTYKFGSSAYRPKCGLVVAHRLVAIRLPLCSIEILEWTSSTNCSSPNCGDLAG